MLHPAILFHIWQVHFNHPLLLIPLIIHSTSQANTPSALTPAATAARPVRGSVRNPSKGFAQMPVDISDYAVPDMEYNQLDIPPVPVRI